MTANALKMWLANSAQGIVELLESLDDEEVADWNPQFAAEHRKWKRERAEQRHNLEGAARRLQKQRA